MWFQRYGKIDVEKVNRLQSQNNMITHHIFPYNIILLAEKTIYFDFVTGFSSEIEGFANHRLRYLISRETTSVIVTSGLSLSSFPSGV